MVNEKVINKVKTNLVKELYYAGILYRTKVLTYADYMKLVTALRTKYK